MGIWDVYESRVCAQGKTKREAALFRTSRRLREKLPIFIISQCDS